MATTKDFDSYEIRIAGGNTGRVGLIMCYQGADFVGRIDFQPDGTALTSEDVKAIESALGTSLRTLGQIQYVNSANLRLRTIVERDPDDKVTVLLVANR